MPTIFPITIPHAPTGLVNQAALDTAFTTPINDLAAGTINATFASYTPALLATTTNPTLGTGSAVFGRYMQIGKLVIAPVSINFGTSGTNAGSGTFSISLPVAPATPTQAIVIGTGKLQSAGAQKSAYVQLTPAGLQQIRYEGGGATNASNTTPGAWTANDQIFITFFYEAA